MYDKPVHPVLDKTLGYEYFMDKGHPLGDRRGRVYFHRHIASLKMGRWLTPEEIVHHKDGNRSNNDPDNLEVMTSAEHTREHKEYLSPKSCPWCKEGFAPEKIDSVHCSENCSYMASRKFHLTPEELFALVWKYPMSRLGPMLGVSDRAIKKRCKLFGVKTPPVGYWNSH